MNNKWLIFGIVILMFASFGSAFIDPFTGQECSTTPSDYTAYDDDGHSWSSANDYYVNATLQTDDTIFVIFEENMYFTDSGDAGVQSTPQNTADSQIIQMRSETDNWNYYAGGWIDTGILSDHQVYYNLTRVVDFDSNLWNFTVNSSSINGQDDDNAFRNAVDFNEIYYSSTGGANSLTGIYIWNCTSLGGSPSGNCSCPSGAAPPPPPAASNSINMTADPEPENGSNFNVATVNFNVSLNASNQYNCSYYLNDTLNTSTDNHSAGDNQTIDFNITFGDDGEYNFTIGCYDGLNDTNSTTNVFFMDFETPVISTDFLNYSVFFQNNLTAQFNLSDNILLHTFNLSIDDKLVFNITHIHELTYDYNLSWNVSNLTVGEHNMTVLVTDGHTAFELKNPYEWSDGLFNNYMKYEFVEGGYVRTEQKDISVFDRWETTRLTDRYTQTFYPSKQSDTYTFTERSDKPIYIVNKPGHYNDQWIIFGDHWKDYVVKGEPTAKVSIKRINTYEVEVTVSGIKNNQKRIEFESIGDLNIVTQVFPFYVTAGTTTYTSPILETQSQTMTLVLNKTDNVTTDAGLIYNGTAQTVTKTSTSIADTYTASFTAANILTVQENITFIWNYTLTAPGANEVENLTFNQTVNQLGLDNCSSFTTTALNITVVNETDGINILDNSSFIKGYFKAWVSSEDDFSEFNITWGAHEGKYGLCIDPDDGNYTIDAQLEYGATGFTTKLYYFNDYNVDNISDNLTLFLTDGTTTVTLTVKDFDDSVVEEAVIKVLSYDLATDSFSTTEIVETDTNGEALVQLILNTEWYAFIVEVDGEVELQTLPAKITTSTKTLRIDLSDIKYFDRYDVTRGITHSLTWTNSSNTFTFTWSDPSSGIVDACLKVIRTNVGQQAVLSDTCTTSTAGSKLYTITETITDQTYTATSYVKFSSTESYILDTLTQSFDRTFKKFGLTGIFVSFLVTLTLIGIGIWSPVVAVLLAIFALAITSILGIFSVGWGALIGLIIMGGIIIYKLTKN